MPIKIVRGDITHVKADVIVSFSAYFNWCLWVHEG